MKNDIWDVDHAQAEFIVVVSLIMLASFFLIAPNSFLEGAFLLDTVGFSGVSFAAGLVGSAGYIGSVLTAIAWGHLTTFGKAGWIIILISNLVLTLISLICSIVYKILDQS